MTLPKVPTTAELVRDERGNLTLSLDGVEFPYAFLDEPTVSTPKAGLALVTVTIPVDHVVVDTRPPRARAAAAEAVSLGSLVVDLVPRIAGAEEDQAGHGVVESNVTVGFRCADDCTLAVTPDGGVRCDRTSGACPDGGASTA